MDKVIDLIMLPTKQKSEIGSIMKCIKETYYIDKIEIGTLCINKNWIVALENGNEFWQPQHLYITSDEEIKEGEYGIDIRDNKIFKCDRILNNHYEQGILQFQKSYCLKIIATTDISLTITNYNNGTWSYLPQPSQQFIQHYIEEYNKGNIITKVMVEYEKATYEKWLENGASPVFDTLKVNSDNTINIKPTKDSWSKEEVSQEKEEFIHLFFSNHYDKLSNIGFTSQYIREWIKENL